MKYHTQLLTLTGDGAGSWTISRVGTAEERMGIDREIGSLEKRLAAVEGWEKRVHELDRLLSSQDMGGNGG
jgi:ATP-binding cassette subfamily D (ALD) long-chain fatty acid import protein